MNVLFTISVLVILIDQNSKDASGLKIRQEKFNHINHDLELDFKSMKNALSFIQTNYKQFNVDGLMGIVLAEGRLLTLNAILKNISEDNGLNVDFGIFKVQWLLKEIMLVRLQIIQNILNGSNSEYFKKFQMILLPALWVQQNTDQFSYKKVLVQGYKNIAIKWKIQQSKHASYNVTFGNTSQIISSDDCIGELFLLRNNNLQSLNMAIFQRILSKKCRIAMFGKSVLDAQHGYPLSHRLLFLQVAERLNILSSADNDYKKYAKTLCLLMLNDVATVLLPSKEYAFTIKHNDLVLEDVVLCAIQGIIDARFRNLWHSQILRMQTNTGCFSLWSSNSHPPVRYISKTVSSVKSKRSMNFVGNTDEYCTDHTTGLGLAGVATHATYLAYEYIM